MTTQQQEEALRALTRMNQKINDLVDGIEILMKINDFSAKDALLLITANNGLQIDENIKNLALKEVKNRLRNGKISA